MRKKDDKEMALTPFVQPGVFLRYDPPTKAVPLLVDVSRSGREYPHDFRSPLPFNDLHDNVSMYVEELFSEAPSIGATLLYACFPNTYIDTNRSSADVDESLIEGKWPIPIRQSDYTQRGLGLLKRLSRYGEPLQERKLTVQEVQERIRRYHEPYHVELARILKSFKDTSGKAVQLSCHCMSAVGAPTHIDPGQPRADFNLGNMKGVSCSSDFMAFATEVLESLGHTVSHNFPYYGGELIARHGDPKGGVDSLFVEVNKRLFIDTKTFIKTENFSNLKNSIDEFLAKVIEYASQKLEDRPRS